MLFGNVWGVSTLLSGLVQGLGAELVFLLFRYRRFTLPVAILAGVGAALGAWIFELFYGSTPNILKTVEFNLIYLGSVVLSGIVLAGIVGWLLVRALAATGRWRLSRRAGKCAATSDDAPRQVTADGWGWRYAGRRAPAVSDVSFTIEPGSACSCSAPRGRESPRCWPGSPVSSAVTTKRISRESSVWTASDLVAATDASDSCCRTPTPESCCRPSVMTSRSGWRTSPSRGEMLPRVREALDSVGLDVPLERSTAELSGGQKQRLVLAGVLAMRPGLLLLDEPTANLDPGGVADIRASVERVLETTGATLIVIEHRTEVWADLLTRVIVLDADGGLLADGHPDAVFTENADVLAAAGVWVPGLPMDLVPLPGPPEGAPARLEMIDLAVSRDRKSAVLGGIDGQIPAGAATVLTGPNGIGKSTLALTLAGLLPEFRGEVRASEELATARGRRPSAWKSRDLLRRIGTVFQEPEHQFLASTVRDELLVGPRAAGMSSQESALIVDELLEQLGLARLAAANLHAVRGQKRRLSVATVLGTAPRVIVLDEPTFGQDRNGWRGLIRLLQRQIETGTSVVAVTHDAEVGRYLGGQHLGLTPYGIERRA